MSTRRKIACLGTAAALALIGCAPSSDDSATTTSAGAGGGASTTVAGDGSTTTSSGEPTPTGPAPGVTDDTIEVGVAYVDTAALVASGLNFDLGDHEAVYNALFDDINANGGINGRQLEPVFAPIDPTSAAPAEEACLKLTEDDDVFVIIGFFLGDSVMCPLETHQTAVVGGGQSPELAARAAAPWVTWTPDTDLIATILQKYSDDGDLDGNVAVFASSLDQGQLDDHVLPTLTSLGITPVDVGINDTPQGDTAATQAQVKLLAERFKAANADTVVLVGPSGQNWPTYMADDPTYRPKLLFLDTTAMLAFSTNAATTDTSILDGALAGGAYGPSQAIFDDQGMQDCISILTAAGLDTPSPDESGTDPSNQPFQAAFQACPDMALLQAILEAAGPTLNYGTLAAGIEGLHVTIPGDPTERTYGPPPAGDGDPAAYLFEWDEASHSMVPHDG